MRRHTLPLFRVCAALSHDGDVELRSASQGSSMPLALLRRVVRMHLVCDYMCMYVKPSVLF